MQSLLHLLSSDFIASALVGSGMDQDGGLEWFTSAGLYSVFAPRRSWTSLLPRFVLMRGISYEHVYVVDFSSKIVTVGLVLLWISGIWFLIHYGVVDPDKLQNPKIWAKIAIVVVLSLNGFLVHFFVLPRIRNQVGKRLLDGLSQFHCSLVLLAGTVSAISWYVPLMLGAIPQLNYVVPAEVILVSYALLLIAVNTLIQAAIVFLLGEYSIPVISDRSKMNMLRGSFALASH